MADTTLELLITAKTDELRRELSQVQKQVESLGEKTKKSTESFGSGFKSALPEISKAAVGMAAAGLALKGAQIGLEGMLAKEQALAEFSAITGVSGDKLKEFGDAATALSNQFGGSTVDNIESFKGVLSRLGPDFASSSAAVETMGRNINVLGKAAGLDATQSMDALTTAMLQFGVSLDDPVQAAGVATNMMNVMAAAAQEGAAEVPQVAEALKQVGVTAKALNVSFEETNSAIQILAAGGKVGSEAGIALRNTLVSLVQATGPGEDALKKLGLSTDELGKILTEKGVSAAMGLFNERLSKYGSAADQAALKAIIFGKENLAASGILLNGADAMQKLTEKISGTNAAFEQANTIMATNTERLARMGAAIENSLVRVFEDAKAIIGETIGFLENLRDLNFDEMGASVGRATTAFINFSTLGLADTFAQWVFGAESLNEALGLVQRKAVDVAGTMKQVTKEQDNIARAEAARMLKISEAEFDRTKITYDMVAAMDVAKGKTKEQITETLEYFKSLQRVSEAENKAAADADKKKKKKESPIAGSLGALEAELKAVQDRLQNKTTIGSPMFVALNDQAAALERRIGSLKKAMDQSDLSVQAMGFTLAAVSPEMRMMDVATADLAANMGTAGEVSSNLEDAFGTLGGAITQGLSGGADAWKQSLKAILIGILDFLNAEYVAAGAAVALRALLSGGFSLFADVSGYAAASVALLAARGAIGSFEVGAMNIPQNQLALVHQGEMIVPRTFAESIRSGDAALVGAGGGGNGFARKGPRQRPTPRMHISAFQSATNAAAWEDSRGVG